MWKQTLVFTVNFIFFINIEAVLLPSKCNINNSECVTKSAQEFISTFAAGIPEIGLKESDPLPVKYIDASSPGLKLILSDVTMTGLKDTIIKKIKFHQSNNSAEIKLLCTAQLKGHYEMSGNLLFLQIEGNGPLHVTLRKMDLTMNVDVNETPGKDGKKYWHYEYRNHTYTLKDKSDVVFENLLSGNELLASAAKDVISQSGNEIIFEVGGPVIKAAMVGVLERINNFMSAIPVEDLRYT